jgi:[ribosomal protein S5]-alanine N-acetyltransferase
MLSVCTFLCHYISQSQVGFRMDQYFLQSARLGFRQWSRADLPLAMALWGDPETTRFIGGPFSPEEIQERLDTEIDRTSRHNVQYWPIFLLESQEHVGCAGLRPYRLGDQIFELGVHLRNAYWGRGLAEEAARAVIKFAFENVGVKALFAGHHPANSASQHLILKLGFRRTHVEFYPPTGLNHPSYLLEPPSTS